MRENRVSYDGVLHEVDTSASATMFLLSCAARGILSENCQRIRVSPRAGRPDLREDAQLPLIRVAWHQACFFTPVETISVDEG